MEVEKAVDPVASPAPVANARSGAVRARRLLVAGALVVTCGVGLVGTSHPDLGGPALMAGWLLLAAGIHRFGRGA
jgi:hypothetical protein